MQEIFFVCDNQESPEDRRSFLEMSGYQVSLMQSGDECLDRLAKTRPALVLMEILLEGANGFDVCRKIRQKYAAAAVPVILCSGIYRGRAYRDEALTAGAQRYIVLPMELEEFADAVQEVLQESKAATKAA